MPHKCTRCGKVYPDGDYRILNGCECGNNKFLYVPKELKVNRVVEKDDIMTVVERLKVKTGESRGEIKEIVENVEKAEIDRDVSEGVGEGVEERELMSFGEDIESVKIIAPGMYEIKLENILSRNGLVIALQEEGRYVIHLPSFLRKKRKR